MGCWNETCAVSKMAIYAGEPVRFLPIVQNAWHFEEQGGFPNGESPLLLKGSSGVYISDLWVPFCLPIRGEYNDYGTIENIPENTQQDKAELSQFIEAFKKNAIPLELGENEYHDTPLKNFTLEEILEALQEGRVFSRYRGAGKDIILTVSWMMIKESVWESLLNMDILKTDEGSFYKMCIKRDGGDTITRKGIRAAIKKKCEFNRISKSANGAKELIEIMRDVDAGYRTRMWDHAPHEFRAPFNDDLIDTFADAEYVHSILSLLRINYAPTTGSGSQNSNYKLWKDTFVKWKKIAHKDEHRWDEE